MQTKTIAIQPFEVFKIKAEANSSGKYWFIAPSLQDKLGGAIAASSETLLGPYVGSAIVRIETSLGSISVERVGISSPVPTSLSDYIHGDVAVASVNGKTGAVVLAAADVGALPDSYTPPAAPVESVNGETGAVSLSAADVGALPDSYTPPAFPQGAAVADAVDDTDIVAQFNALLASLRAANIIAT